MWISRKKCNFLAEIIEKQEKELVTLREYKRVMDSKLMQEKKVTTLGESAFKKDVEILKNLIEAGISKEELCKGTGVCYKNAKKYYARIASKTRNERKIAPLHYEFAKGKNACT